MKIVKSIFITDSVWQKAKVYAAENKIALSKIIEDYLIKITKKEKNK